MKLEELKTSFYECTCYDPDHLLRVDYFDESSEWEFDSEISIKQLIPGETFFQRVKHAFKHIFNGRKKWTGFSDTCVSYEDTKRLIKFLQGFVKRHDDYFSSKK